MTGILVRRGKFRHRHAQREEGPVKAEAQGCIHRPRDVTDAGHQQELEGTREDTVLEAVEGAWP